MISKARRITILGGSTIAASALVGMLQLPQLLARRRLEDFAWRSVASTEELRETAHAALGLWAGDPHEALILLCSIGDQSSIPYLQRALAHHPKPRDGGIECTWSHGYDALKRIQSNARREPNTMSSPPSNLELQPLIAATLVVRSNSQLDPTKAYQLDGCHFSNLKR